MKISMREIILIALLAIIAWGYIAITLIVAPARENAAGAEARLAEAQIRQQSAQMKIEALPELAAKEQEAFERAIKEADLYFPNFTEESLVVFIHNLAGRTGLRVNLISASGFSLRDLDQLIAASHRAEQEYLTGQLAKALAENESEAGEGEAAEADASPAAGDAAGGRNRSGIITNAAYVYSVQIDYSNASYSQLSSFLKGFEDLGKLSTVNNVSVTTGNQGGLGGGFMINLMAVDSIIHRESPFGAVRLTTTAGKPDPFGR